MTDTIRDLLAQASEFDAAARERRKAAGRLLAALRDETPVLGWLRVLADIGIDQRTASMLIDLATGRTAA